MARYRLWRNVALLCVGLGGILHQTLIENGAERPSLLILFAGMVGLPLTLRKDESGKSDSNTP